MMLPPVEAVDRTHERGEGPGVARAAGRKAERVEQVVRRGRCGGGAEPLAEQPAYTGRDMGVRSTASPSMGQPVVVAPHTEPWSWRLM